MVLMFSQNPRMGGGNISVLKTIPEKQIPLRLLSKKNRHMK